MKKETREALLTEYQCAQDSAQHHDNLVWTTTGTLWATNFVLIGFIISNWEKQIIKENIFFISILGIILCIVGWIIAWQFGSIRNQKYERCKAIERFLDLEQHRNLKYRKGCQHWLYGIMMSLFIIIWVVILIKVYKNPHSQPNVPPGIQRHVIRLGHRLHVPGAKPKIADAIDARAVASSASINGISALGGTY